MEAGSGTLAVKQEDLNYSVFIIERKDNLEMVAVDPNTSISDFFTPNCAEKNIQDKNMWWT